MNQSNNRENNVNGNGSSNGEGVTFGSGSGGQQPDLGRHQATARRKWNIVLGTAKIIRRTLDT